MGEVIEIRDASGELLLVRCEVPAGGSGLRGAVLEGAVLTGARYDERTRFPAGFSPEAAGMVRAIED